MPEVEMKAEYPDKKENGLHNRGYGPQTEYDGERDQESRELDGELIIMHSDCENEESRPKEKQ
jgi:hypothetical protein